MSRKYIEHHKFYMKLHYELAQKYMVPVENISSLRDLAIGQGRTKKEIIQIVEDDMHRKKGAIKRIKSDSLAENHQLITNFKQTMLNFQAQKNLIFFLRKCTDEVWADITQITKFDRSGQRFPDNRKEHTAHEVF
jgi:hypothetical protein